MNETKRILICPLDWGLGHATRCIPIICELLSQGCEVRIASSGQALALLKKEFPELMAFSLTGYDPYYSDPGLLTLSLACQLPKFIRTIQAEHREIENIIRQDKIGFVISDNRFGCWSSLVPCVMITHQLHIRLPVWLSGIVNVLNHKQIRKFTFCWVPDWEGLGSLSGELSTRPPFAVSYVGPLSRFRKIVGVQNRYEILAVISGPEPQRTFFEVIVREELRRTGKKAMLVRGLPECSERKMIGNVEEVDSLSSAELNKAILESEIVLSRPGYSTIMDLAKLERRAIFVPTPGQTEQEYLGAELMRKGIAFCTVQAGFDLDRALEAERPFTGFGAHVEDELLKKELDKLLI